MALSGAPLGAPEGDAMEQLQMAVRGVRWLLVPPVYLLAIVLAGACWNAISRNLALDHCPPGLGGRYGDGTDFACHWPLWFALLKDGLAAPLAAATIVLLPTLVAPRRREAIAWILGGLTLLLWLTYQMAHYRSGRHVPSHQLVVAVAFGAGVAAVVWVFRRLRRTAAGTLED
jgi:hypothetical protein